MPKSILKISLVLFGVFFLLVLLGSLYIGREDSIGFLMRLSAFPADKRNVMEGLLSANRLLILQTCVAVLIATISLFCYKLDTVYYYIERFYYYWARAIKGIFSDLKTKNALLVLAIPFVSCIYFAFTIPVSYDEGYTYLEFTNKPFYFCSIFYPCPNNHVLHSLLTNLSDLVPFTSTLFKLRIPAMVASIGAWMVAYSFVKRFYSEKLALLVVGIASMGFMALYYGFMARGYSMALLFFVISLYASFNIITKGNQTKDWAFFIVSSALGFYTIPSFLYPYITLNVFIFIHNYKQIKKQIIWNVLTLFSVILLYMPIIVRNGIKALVGNDFVVPKSRALVLELLPSFYNETLFDLFKLPTITTFILIVLAIAIAVKHKDKFSLVAWAVFCIAPFVLLLTHSVIPFSRTFSNCLNLVLYSIQHNFDHRQFNHRFLGIDMIFKVFRQPSV